MLPSSGLPKLNVQHLTVALVRFGLVVWFVWAL